MICPSENLILKEIKCSNIKIYQKCGNLEATGLVKITSYTAEQKYILRIKLLETEFERDVKLLFFI